VISAVALAKRGYPVVIGDVDNKKGAEVAVSIETMGGKAVSTYLDVTDSVSWEEASELVIMSALRASSFEVQ
jgi:hypothetical protein